MNNIIKNVTPAEIRNVFCRETMEVKGCYLSRYQASPLTMKVRGRIGFRADNRISAFFRKIFNLKPRVRYEYTVTSDLDKVDVKHLDQSDTRVFDTITRMMQAENDMAQNLYDKCLEYNKQDRERTKDGTC